MTCMAPSFDINPLTRMWQHVTTSCILITSFVEYVKLAKLAMVQVVGNVEDERCFFPFTFMKFKLCNRLTTHLSLVVRLFVQHFYINTKFLIWGMHWTMENCSPSLLVWWVTCDQWFFFRELKGPSKGSHFFVPTYVCWFVFESQCLNVKMATPFVSIIMACSTCFFPQLTIYFLLYIMNLDLYCIVVHL